MVMTWAMLHGIGFATWEHHPSQWLKRPWVALRLQAPLPWMFALINLLRPLICAKTCLLRTAIVFPNQESKRLAMFGEPGTTSVFKNCHAFLSQLSQLSQLPMIMNSPNDWTPQRNVTASVAHGIANEQGPDLTRGLFTKHRVAAERKAERGVIAEISRLRGDRDGDP